jgi:hypothetical protein
MNEQHEDDVKRFGAKITPFKKQNRHLLIGPDFRPGTMAYADKYGYTYSWNYAEEGTREHLLAVLDEMLQRYFVDGLELDYGRGACYFSPFGATTRLSKPTTPPCKMTRCLSEIPRCTMDPTRSPCGSTERVPPHAIRFGSRKSITSSITVECRIAGPERESNRPDGDHPRTIQTKTPMFAATHAHPARKPGITCREGMGISNVNSQRSSHDTITSSLKF